MATYIANLPAPERAGGEYNGHSPSLWEGGSTGFQPQTETNAKGNIPSVPFMALTPEVLKYMSGPQPS